MDQHSLIGIESAINEITNLPKPTVDTTAALNKFKPTIKLALKQGQKLPLLLSIINKHQTKYDGQKFTMEQLEKFLGQPDKKKKSSNDADSQTVNK